MNVYSLRVNLSIAIVAMTTNYTTIVNGTAVEVREFRNFSNWFKTGGAYNVLPLNAVKKVCQVVLSLL